MVSKITKEHWSQFLVILVIVGIWIALIYGYILSQNEKHKVAECEAYASGKYSVTNDKSERDVMMDSCDEKFTR